MWSIHPEALSTRSNGERHSKFWKNICFTPSSLREFSCVHTPDVWTSFEEKLSRNDVSGSCNGEKYETVLPDVKEEIHSKLEQRNK